MYDTCCILYFRDCSEFDSLKEQSDTAPTQSQLGLFKSVKNFHLSLLRIYLSHSKGKLFLVLNVQVPFIDISSCEYQL